MEYTLQGVVEDRFEGHILVAGNPHTAAGVVGSMFEAAEPLLK
jgi:hypothetical protein